LFAIHADEKKRRVNLKEGNLTSADRRLSRGCRAVVLFSNNYRIQCAFYYAFVAILAKKIRIEYELKPILDQMQII
jgi:hypothetical protein